METAKQRLRLRFEAETDIVIEPDNENWKQYAEWLENVTADEINNKLIKENELLLMKIREAMAALAEGITSV